MGMAELWHRPLLSEDRAFLNATLLGGRIASVCALLPNAARKIITFNETAAAMGGAAVMVDGRPWFGQAPLLSFPAPSVFLALSVAMDLFATVLVIFGWKARLAAFLLAGYAIIAIVIFHGDIRSGQDAVGIMRNLSLVGGCLLVAGMGPGWWSIDGLLARRKTG